MRLFGETLVRLGLLLMMLSTAGLLVLLRLFLMIYSMMVLLLTAATWVLIDLLLSLFVLHWVGLGIPVWSARL